MRLRDALDRYVIGWREAIRQVGRTEVADVRELHGPTRTLASTGGNWSERDTWDESVVPTAGDNVVLTAERHDHAEMLDHLRDEWGTLGVLMALLEPLSPPVQDAVLAAAVVKLKPQDSGRPLPS